MARAATSTSAEYHFERSRRIAAAVLAFFVMVMLVEVVIAPGTMIRHHLHSPNAPVESGTPTSLILHQQRLERLCAGVDTEWGNLRQSSVSRIGVDLAEPDVQKPPLFISGNQTAAAAWADFRQAAPVVIKQISDARAITRATADRINAKKVLDTDDRDILDAIGRLEAARQSVQRMNAELDHIDLVQQTATRPSAAK